MFDRCKPVRHLFIAVPAYTGQVSTETAAAIVAAVSVLIPAGVRITTKFRNGNCYLDEARNQLVADFLESDATDLLFWDADVGCLPETVLKLCLVTRPIVAAIYPKKSDAPEWPVQFFPGERWTDAEGLLPVKMMPTGLMRINRGVFEAMNPPRYADPKGRVLGAYFRCDVREYYFGEDVEFCRVWREMGGTLRILPEATLCHWGMKSWIGNIGEAMAGGAA